MTVIVGTEEGTSEGYSEAIEFVGALVIKPTDTVDSQVGASVLDGLQLGSMVNAEDDLEVGKWDGVLVGLTGLHQDKKKGMS